MGDVWAKWLLTRRDSDGASIRARHASSVEAFRDGVLDRADLRADDVLLDVGCGTGLVGFGALDRLGPGGHVIFSDISADLLDECRRTAAHDERCSFVRAAADDLATVPDASVDVVTTRSVLIYCARKQAAFVEFHRVLRPGGRLSIFEPINRFAVLHRPGDLFGLGRTPVDDLLAKVARQMGAAETLVDFDERDLLTWAAAAGFEAVELDYRAQLDVPAEPFTDWQAVKQTAPNPLAPTYGEAIAAALTRDERERLESYMATTGARCRRTMATAYLRAQKADAPQEG
ncbi:methyltransferase domain-containing protein [Actinoplanes sp. NBC_00393]|uniref:class I SAM-dependent methyltransferase n=1 Tax=Actinoplanes sp. NBC_00393 TaxID=2975953 RepID=UPI002E1A0F6F